ncbi:rCG52111 [Rattus norvegicus]|uniref:RCG52111 n=1 Tax=Rattus norvegicus TaxID=10116 RepID=A6K6P6_RAT|nr:rCG52111 [Rattus norvegicus]
MLQVPSGNHTGQCATALWTGCHLRFNILARLVLLSWGSLEEVQSLQACKYTFIWTYLLSLFLAVIVTRRKSRSQG